MKCKICGYDITNDDVVCPGCDTLVEELFQKGNVIIYKEEYENVEKDESDTLEVSNENALNEEVEPSSDVLETSDITEPVNEVDVPEVDEVLPSEDIKPIYDVISDEPSYDTNIDDISKVEEPIYDIVGDIKPLEEEVAPIYDNDFSNVRDIPTDINEPIYDVDASDLGDVNDSSYEPIYDETSNVEAIETPIEDTSIEQIEEAPVEVEEPIETIETEEVIETPEEPIETIETEEVIETPEETVEPIETEEVIETPEEIIEPIETEEVIETPEEVIEPIETVEVPEQVEETIDDTSEKLDEIPLVDDSSIFEGFTIDEEVPKEVEEPVIDDSNIETPETTEVQADELIPETTEVQADELIPDTSVEQVNDIKPTLINSLVDADEEELKPVHITCQYIGESTKNNKHISKELYKQKENKKSSKGRLLLTIIVVLIISCILSIAYYIGIYSKPLNILKRTSANILDSIPSINDNIEVETVATYRNDLSYKFDITTYINKDFDGITSINVTKDDEVITSSNITKSGDKAYVFDNNLYEDYFEINDLDKYTLAEVMKIVYAKDKILNLVIPYISTNMNITDFNTTYNDKILKTNYTVPKYTFLNLLTTMVEDDAFLNDLSSALNMNEELLLEKIVNYINLLNSENINIDFNIYTNYLSNKCYYVEFNIANILNLKINLTDNELSSIYLNNITYNVKDNVVLYNEEDLLTNSKVNKTSSFDIPVGEYITYDEIAPVIDTSLSNNPSINDAYNMIKKVY